MGVIQINTGEECGGVCVWGVGNMRWEWIKKEQQNKVKKKYAWKAKRVGSACINQTMCSKWSNRVRGENRELGKMENRKMIYRLEMTAKVKSVVVEEPPMSGVLTAPPMMVLETALAILLAWSSRPRWRSIITEERIMAEGLAVLRPWISFPTWRQPY